MHYELYINTEHCLPKHFRLERNKPLPREGAQALLLPQTIGSVRVNFGFAFSYQLPDLLRNPLAGTTVLLLDQQRIERNEHRFLYSCELWTRLLWIRGKEYRFLSLRSCEEDAEVWSQLFSADEKSADPVQLASAMEGMLKPLDFSELMPARGLFSSLPEFL